LGGIEDDLGAARLERDIGRDDAVHAKQAIAHPGHAVRAAHALHRQQGCRLFLSFLDGRRFVDDVDVKFLVHIFFLPG